MSTKDNECAAGPTIQPRGVGDCLRSFVTVGRVFCLLAALALCLPTTSGCDPTDSGRLGRRAVAIGDVPEPVCSAAKFKLPDVEFTDAWKNVDRDGTLHSYEIRGKNKNGKTREVRVSPAGAILEIE